MNSDLLKGGIDLLTGLVDVLEALVDNLGLLGTAGLGVGIWSFVKNFGDIKAFASLAKEVGGVSTAFKQLGGFASLSASAVAGAIGIIVAAIGLGINAYKNYKEKQAEARQEAIETADTFLESSRSFEQAYIKYSGRTDLTTEEEEELKTAINGTVDALGDKSSALQNAVNGSNDYVASLERIKKAELEAAAAAAKEKKEAAKTELKETVKGWSGLDGSEVDVVLGAVMNSATDDNPAKKSADIASEIAKEYLGSNSSLQNTAKTYRLELSPDADVNEIIDYYNTLKEYKQALADAELTDTTAYKNVEAAIGKMSGAIEVYTSGVYDAAKAQYQLKEGIPKTVDEYLKMREAILEGMEGSGETFDTKVATLNALESEYGQIFDLSSAKAQAKKFIGVIKGWGNGIEDGTDEIGTIKTFLDLRTKVNNNEVPVSEYMAQFKAIDDLAENAGWSEEEKNLVYTSFGLDTDGIKQQYEEMQQYLQRQVKLRPMNDGESALAYATNIGLESAKVKSQIDEFLNDLTAEELAAVIDLKTEIDWKNASAEDIRKQIEDQVKLNEALNFDASIEVDKTALEAFNTALAESASAMGLSEESIDSLKAKYSELEGYNPHTLFEKTANGVKVNREELAKLEKKYNDLTKTEVQEHLDTLADAYNDVTAEIDECTNAGKRAELLAKREMYADQIEELATYQSQLEGVTGAYQKWLDAQGGSEDYEGYESIATSKEDIQDEIDRGFISNKGKAYIDLLSGENLEGKPIDDYYNAWKKLEEKVGSTSYSIHDFFTVNDDGDITSTGVDRFFKGLQQDFKGSVAKFNDETGKWEYDFSQENLQKIQDEWGIGIEAIELLLEAAASAGYDVDWGGIFDDLDLDTSNFETLVSVAEKAQKELNKLEGYEDLDFNFSTTTVEAATSELERAQKTYNELVTNDDGTINLDAKGADNVRVILATLLVQKQQLEDSEIAINISTSGLDDSQAKAVAWVQDFRTKYKNLEIAISTGEGIEEAKTELETVKTSLGELDGDTAKIAAQLVLGEDTNTSGDGFKTQVNNAIDSIGKQDINVGFKLDETAISDLNSNLLTNFTVDTTAKITNVDKSQLEAVETSGVVNWDENTDNVSKSFEATGTVNWNDDVKNVKTSFSANGTVNWTSGNNVKVKVISEVNGTANANGTTLGRAFARGNWGIKGSGTALVGELGMETLVRGGRFYTIGDSGAEFVKYKQGDIIFNHKQTEELFKNGKVTSDGGRGKMFVNGSAFADGSYPTSGRAFAWNASVGSSVFAASRHILSSKSEDKKEKAEEKIVISDNTVNVNSKVSETEFSKENSKTEKVKTDTKDKFEETFDWVAIAIERIEREIDNLDKKVNNTYTSWTDRNTALTSEISKVGNEITLQGNAAEKYLDKANSVGLDESYVEKIKNGSLNIENFEGESDEALVEKIKEYQKWYELYLQCIDKAEQLKQTEAELYAQRFENVSAQYDGILQGYEHTESMLNEYISQAEAKGHIVSKNYYQALIDNENDNIDELEKKQSDLITKRDEAVASGKIVEGSQAWYEMCAEIDGVTQEIEAATTATIEWNNAIRDLDWEVFDLIQERISDVTSEADFLIELMSNDKLFDDNGKMTDKGKATIGLHGQNYNTYMYQADDYGAKVKEIDDKIASGELDGNSQDVINKRREYVEAQREAILNAEREKQAIKDLVEEGINLELDALQEKIDKTNEAIDSQKDLYDYQKKVKEQSEEIANLEKQRAAYLNDDSEESKAKLQEITVSLKEAKENLKETEYDKFISDQSALLDTLYEEYELILNQRLDNVDALLSDMITEINANATTISTTLTNEASNVGTTLSEAMKNIWSGEGEAKSVIAEYGKGFQDKQTTTNIELGKIVADVNDMVDDVDKDATNKVNSNKTSTSAKKDPTKDVNPSKKEEPKKEEKPKVTDDTLKGIAAAIWIYGKDSGWGNNPFREDKLTNKLGAENAKKVQDIVNAQGESGGLYSYWIKTGRSSLKQYRYNAFALGARKIDETQLAWTQEKGQEFIVRPSDGAILTPIAKGDSVLNANASNNIWDMANSPAEFIKDNLKLSATSVPNNSNTQSSVVQNFEKVVFSMPNVKNYSELLSEMQKDPKFEKLILAMTIEQIAGKSSLTKGKSIR